MPSAEEFVSRVLTRLRETEPKVHAYVQVLADRALEEARRLDGETVRRPLHGIPFAVKEVFDVASVQTTGGSRVFHGRVPDADAFVVDRLRSVGAVLLGTQRSHELTCGLDEPATLNPWNIARYPGGSSVGAGVSVAVGSAEFALGTDAAGSIRIPAAMTGVVGFKPSIGVISKQGVMRQASAPSIDNVGIMAGTVSLVADVFREIAFPDPKDAATLLHRPTPPAATSSRSEDLSRCRISVLGQRTLAELDEICEREPAVAEAFDTACAKAREAGARLVEVELPTLHRAGAAVFTFFSMELSVAHRAAILGGDDRYHPRVRAMMVAALQAPQSRLEAAVAVRAQLLAEVDAALRHAGADMLLTPTTPRVAMLLSSFLPEEQLGTLIPYTCGFNLTGHPAISLPNGLDHSGLPIGLQIVGHRLADFALLDFAAAFERIAPTMPHPAL